MHASIPPPFAPFLPGSRSRVFPSKSLFHQRHEAPENLHFDESRGRVRTADHQSRAWTNFLQQPWCDPTWWAWQSKFWCALIRNFDDGSYLYRSWFAGTVLPDLTDLQRPYCQLEWQWYMSEHYYRWRLWCQSTSSALLSSVSQRNVTDIKVRHLCSFGVWFSLHSHCD